MSNVELSPFRDVLADFKAGKAVIIVDDEKRENEGDVVMAAEYVDAAALSFFMREARGLICVSIPVERAKTLNLPLQALSNNSSFGTPFAVSVDHSSVAASGVTAASRAATMRRLADVDARGEEFVSPGHVFPLIAHPAGVLGRQGQTEGSLDLALILGMRPAAVLCEILNPDGSMARGVTLDAFASRHGLRITSVQAILQYRISEEVVVREVAQAELRTQWGLFHTTVFMDDVDGKEHMLLEYGRSNRAYPPLVRMHSECLTGDVFGSRRCDCGVQLAAAMERIVSEGSGILVYLRQEGRGIGLSNKLKAYALQDLGQDTVEANLQLGFRADQRDYAAAAKMLAGQGVRAVRLLTNNPNKIQDLERYGIEVVERVALVAPIDEYSTQYLETKRTKLGHLFDSKPVSGKV